MQWIALYAIYVSIKIYACIQYTRAHKCTYDGIALLLQSPLLSGTSLLVAVAVAIVFGIVIDVIDVVATTAAAAVAVTAIIVVGPKN